MILAPHNRSSASRSLPDRRRRLIGFINQINRRPIEYYRLPPLHDYRALPPRLGIRCRAPRILLGDDIVVVAQFADAADVT